MLETNQNSFQNLLKKQTVLVCPLDWGLGHATRCVPIIEQLLAKGHQVIIGADKTPLAFLTQAFPTLKTVVVPGYTVDYSKKGSLIKLLYESVFFFLFIKKEHAFVQKIIKENKIDVVISDNRYGLWSKAVKSILITHQIYVKFPVGERLMHRIIAKLIQQFDDCWIPDVDGEVNLSGDLSHLQPIQYQHQFIGALSRFSKVNTSNLTEKQPVDFDVIAILPSCNSIRLFTSDRPSPVPSNLLLV